MNLNNISNKYEALCEAAIECARDFKINFDYSEKSIIGLEQILQYYYEDAKEKCPTDEQVWSMSVIFGTYLGQTILKNGGTEKGYYWLIDENKVPILFKDYENKIFPISKVYKRVKNGQNENVKFFYDMAILQIEDKLDLKKDNQ